MRLALVSDAFERYLGAELYHTLQTLLAGMVDVVFAGVAQPD